MPYFNTNFRLVQITSILLQDYIKIKSRPLQDCIRLCAKIPQDYFKTFSGFLQDIGEYLKTTSRIIKPL